MHSFADIEEAKKEVGSAFRTKHGISPEGVVVFFAPGDTVAEYEYSFEAFKRGYNDFINKNSYPTSLSHYAAPRENFTLVISTHSTSSAADWFKTNYVENEYLSKVILVDERNNEHYNAMCVYL